MALSSNFKNVTNGKSDRGIFSCWYEISWHEQNCSTGCVSSWSLVSIWISRYVSISIRYRFCSNIIYRNRRTTLSRSSLFFTDEALFRTRFSQRSSLQECQHHLNHCTFLVEQVTTYITYLTCSRQVESLAATVLKARPELSKHMDPVVLESASRASPVEQAPNIQTSSKNRQRPTVT